MLPGKNLSSIGLS